MRPTRLKSFGRIASADMAAPAMATHTLAQGEGKEKLEKEDFIAMAKTTKATKKRVLDRIQTYWTGLKPAPESDDEGEFGGGASSSAV